MAERLTKTFGILAFLLSAAYALGDENQGYLGLVRGCADALIEHGRDRYGEVHAPIFMSNLDPETLTSPRELPLLDGLVRTEGRGHRRNPGGSDLWEDQTLLRVLVKLTELTGDEKYKQAAEDYIEAFFGSATKPDTGLLTWGTHLYWDAFEDRPGGDGDGRGPHEILIREPDWELMWSVSPEAVAREIEGLWEWHVVDKQTGLFNRHDDKAEGCDFAFQGSELILAFAFMHKQTGETKWRDRARLIADWHWNHRNPETNLCADAPGIEGRFDGTHHVTTIAGPYCALLLRAYAMTDDAFYRDRALAHLRAYHRYGWDEEAKSFWGMLALDGTPVKEDPNRKPRDIDVYEDFMPRGHVEVWRTIMYSYEFPLIAAQSYAYAAELTGDAEMIEATKKWADVIERELPPKAGHRWKHLLAEALPGLEERGGTYAENYGRAIDFFLRAAKVTGEERYEEIARELGAEAVAKLHHSKSGLFVGHASKPMYEATDGVGYLLWALLQLHDNARPLEPNF